MTNQSANPFADQVLSVSEYLEFVNGLVAPLRTSVLGEVSDLKISAQWVFFALKDKEEQASLRCGLHAGQYRRVGVTLEEGMEVKVGGHAKVHEKTGNFGFWVSALEPMGEGALRRAYELLRAKLEAEGLFVRKRALPPFISHIGVISSRNGVVIHDLQKNLAKRGIRIDFLHSAVDGADSARELVSAVEQFSWAKERPEVLVIIRGGGSLESLQGFNNEALCRVLFASPVPTLVGIGHDVDAPLATLVADVSVSTPTAVAQVINASWEPLTSRVPLLTRSIETHFSQRLAGVIHTARLSMAAVYAGLGRLFTRFRSLTHALAFARARMEERGRVMEADIARAQERSLEACGARLAFLQRGVAHAERLLALSHPERPLARGYSLLRSEDGRVIRRVSDVRPGAHFGAQLSDGTIEATANSVTKT